MPTDHDTLRYPAPEHDAHDFHYLTPATREAIAAFVEHASIAAFVERFRVWGEQAAPSATTGAWKDWHEEIQDMRACADLDALLLAVDGEFCAWHLLTDERPCQEGLVEALAEATSALIPLVAGAADEISLDLSISLLGALNIAAAKLGAPQRDVTAALRLVGVPADLVGHDAWTALATAWRSWKKE